MARNIHWFDRAYQRVLWLWDTKTFHEIHNQDSTNLWWRDSREIFREAECSLAIVRTDDKVTAVDKGFH